MSELDTETQSSIRTKVQNKLEQPDVLESWSDDLSFRRANADRLEICLSNDTQARYFEQRFGDLFKTAVRNVLGNDVSLVIHGEPEGDTESNTPACENRSSEAQKPPSGPNSDGAHRSPSGSGANRNTATVTRSASAGRSSRTKTRNGSSLPGYEHALREDYRFEHFVVGPCNRLAHAACLSVLEQPGRAYNPLFIHGPVGHGKSHLLQALCRAHIEQTSDSGSSGRLLYLPCETFVNMYINGICNESIDSVRSRLRQVDLLVIDDVHFLANKSGSQEEFFHTFNALYNSHSQIVLSSDCPPRELPSIEERLMSRFKWGLTTSLDQPEQDTSRAIVERKFDRENVEVNSDIVSYIARIASSVREMEGAVSAVSAAIRFEDHDSFTLDDARRIIGETERHETGDEVSVPDIQDQVSDFFDVERDRLKSGDQSKDAADARHVAIYLASQLTDHSQSEIGAYFDIDNHSSVHYAINKIKDRVREKSSFRNVIQHLKETLND